MEARVCSSSQEHDSKALFGKNEHPAVFPLTWESCWWRTGTACVVLREGFLDGTREEELSVFGGRGSVSGKGRLCSDE